MSKLSDAQRALELLIEISNDQIKVWSELDSEYARGRIDAAKQLLKNLQSIKSIYE